MKKTIYWFVTITVTIVTVTIAAIAVWDTVSFASTDISYCNTAIVETSKAFMEVRLSNCSGNSLFK